MEIFFSILYRATCLVRLFFAFLAWKSSCKKRAVTFLIMLPTSGSDQRHAIKLIDPFRIVNVMK